MATSTIQTETNAGTLLAKGDRSLIEHTHDVMEAFTTLFGQSEQPTLLTAAWLRFFRLNSDEDGPWFLRHGLAAAFCHDWGKANDGFQRMLARRGQQLVRHEHLSAMLMTRDDVGRWLKNGDYDVSLLVAAVVGHHLKARDIDFGANQGEYDQLLLLPWSNNAFQKGLATLTEEVPDLAAGDIPTDIPQLWALDGTRGADDLDEAFRHASDRLIAFDRELWQDESRRRMLWAVRAALIAADAAGSGLVREDKPIADWIEDAFFHPRCDIDSLDGRMTGDTIHRLVIEPRIENIKQSGHWQGFNPFQRACGDAQQVPDRALLLAPCGSGKTLAAWRWIAARCEEQPRRRAIFLYPTRGTATEGYRDYAAHAGPEEAALVHGTADLDLDGIHPDVKDEERINDARLFALRQWPRRLFSATVDQFLGFLQHGYGPTCHLPLLADSVVVFDEIHSYDRGMFSALIELIKHFDVPVLCMTATLLDKRQDDLKKAGLEIVNGLALDGDAQRGKSELRPAAEYPRYRVRQVVDDHAAEEAVREALEHKQRVLWVVNMVDRAQDIARRFAAEPVNLDAEQLTTPEGAPIHCYHSRYRLIDRKAHHDAVVQAFKRGHGSPGAVLAVTTQVCEMSLDLDADVLVTELCPATSLVQRMGRCCRDSEAYKEDRVGEAIVYEPPGDDARARRLPYTTQDMNGVDQFIEELCKVDVISQAQLEGLLQDVPAPADLPKACRFIESGPWAAAGEEQFRDIADLARPALLPCDLNEYARLRKPRKRGDDPPWQADGLVLNVPKKHAQQHGRYDLPVWLHVATGGTYHKTLGFCRNESNGPLIV